MQWISLLSSKRQQGFTLIELLVVLAVAAILLSIAAPSFMNIIANNRVSSAANEMVVALNLAKSEAVKTGKPAVLCKKLENSEGCGDLNNDWGDGWLIYIDEDGIGETMVAGDRIVRVHESTHPSLNFKFFIDNAENPGPIRFRPNGRIQPGGRFCFKNSHDVGNSRAVAIHYSGRIISAVRDASNNNCAP